MHKTLTKTLAAILCFATALSAGGTIDASKDARLRGSFRKPDRNGWIQVHLQGAPAEMGFQHGYHLAAEIADAKKVIELEFTHDSDKDYAFYRDAAKKILWPHVEQQYREELQGIADGVKARGVNLDLWDIVTMNAWQELSPYYEQWRDAKYGKRKKKANPNPPERCSAFVATGSYTKDGGIVMGHNAWTGYMDGARWTVVFDVVPASGEPFIMDGFPGLIHSADDFGVNASGIMITETTISQFKGFDPDGIPEFVRARKAMQYSKSIDDFVRVMKDGNNGGYANTWLVGDRKTGEIASLELGLKHVTLKRSKDGYFVGSNFPENPMLVKDETDFPADDKSISANARRVRWEQLMAEYKGKIDIDAGKRFLADHYDTFDKVEQPSERTLCGHVDLTARGLKGWQPGFGPAGAVQSKVMDSTMAERMAFTGAAGHACGLHFKAATHLREHPEFAWQKEFLRDIDSRPWTEFSAAR